jgi:hypothetical protein
LQVFQPRLFVQQAERLEEQEQAVRAVLGTEARQAVLDLRVPAVLDLRVLAVLDLRVLAV